MDIRHDPIKSDILWPDVVSLVKALGGKVKPAGGSAVVMKLNGIRASFHRPHPGDQTSKGAIKSLRSFFERAGI